MTHTVRYAVRWINLWGAGKLPMHARPQGRLLIAVSGRNGDHECTMSSLTVPEFVSRWQSCTLSERSAAQSHFIEVCDLLGEPRPAEVDQEGNTYTFEKGVTKTFGEDGFADVWMRGHFAWER